jgi:Kef-type K+ transport system membrane component KefB/Trk K+ transport system NAD-binding subunit
METDILIALLLITALAAIIPIFAKRLEKFGIPIVVYEILAGMIIGGSGLNIIEPSSTLEFLAEFGFAFLMFLSGLELDIKMLNPRRGLSNREQPWTQAIPIGVMLFLGTIMAAFMAALFFAPEGATNNPFLLGLILSTTSLGVVVPVLKERELITSHFGQYILVASSIADFATLILLTIVIAILQRGFTLDLLLIPVLLFFFVMVARFSMRASHEGKLQETLNNISSTTSQIHIRGAFALLVAWVVLAEAFGVEVILGAFLAGAIAGLINGGDDHNEREKLDAIGYGFFIPIFFIMVGVHFNLQAVLNSTQGLTLLIWLAVVALLVKLIPALLLKLKFTWRQTIGGGMLLSSRLSLIIAASAIALEMGLISQTVNSDIILLAILTCTISPFLFNRIYPREEETFRRGIIVVGQDQLAEYLIERLQTDQEPVFAICPNQERLQTFKNLGANIIDGCEGFLEALTSLNAGRVRVLLDLTASSNETLEVCRIGREKFNIPLIVSRISEIELIPTLREMGVKVVQPELATAMALEGAVRYPTAFEVMAHETVDIEVSEIVVTKPQSSAIPLGKIQLPGDVLILSIKRDGSIIIPHGDTTLQLSDQLGLIGSHSSINDAAAMFTNL